MIKVSLERALELAAMNNEVYMAVGLNEETPIGEFVMADFYFAPEQKKINREIAETIKEVIENAKPEQKEEPSDVCRHYPPSSADGKPCSMCPAEGRRE